MKFARQTRRVMDVEGENVYRVTSDAVTAAERLPKDPSKHLVGISTAVGYWDCVARRENCLRCARTVRDAWNAGDRFLLDTDEARKAAEIVVDLAGTQPDDRDIMSALTDLQNAIADVCLHNVTAEEFDVLDKCRTAFERCLAIPEYAGWSVYSRRRKLLYELRKLDKGPVSYTLLGLYFGEGPTPLLTSRQRRELVAIPHGDGIEEAMRFFDECLRAITEMRFA